MCRTPWELRHFSHESLVFLTPIDNDFVLVHSTSPNLYLRITARTCLT
jgi:hypothetical protein